MLLLTSPQPRSQENENENEDEDDDENENENGNENEDENEEDENENEHEGEDENENEYESEDEDESENENKDEDDNEDDDDDDTPDHKLWMNKILRSLFLVLVQLRYVWERVAKFLILFNRQQLFQANRDQNSIKMNAINPAIRARFIRLHPRGWHGYPCLRAEFYGCAVGKLLF